MRDMLTEALSQLAAIEVENIELREEVDVLKNSDTIPPVLSPKIISEHSGASPATVSDWLIRGVIKGKKEGGRWFIKREDYLIWLNGEQTERRLKIVKVR